MRWGRAAVMAILAAAVMIAPAPATSARASGVLGTASAPTAIVTAWLSPSWIMKPGTRWRLDPSVVLVSGSVVLVPPGGLGAPAPPGRSVALQQRAGQRWRTLATARTDRNHVATFAIRAPAAGTFRLAGAGGTSDTLAVRRVGGGYLALAAWSWSLPSAQPQATRSEIHVCLLGVPPANATGQRMLLQRHDAHGWHTSATARTSAPDLRSCQLSARFWAPTGTGSFRLLVPRWGLSITHVYGRAS